MDSNSSFMTVPSRQIGRVIGARGSKIREIQQSSDARIQISKEEDDDGNKSIEIQGSDEQIAIARRLIEQCVQDDGRQGFSNRRGMGRQERSDRGNQWGNRDSFQSTPKTYEEEDWGEEGTTATVIVHQSSHRNQNNGSTSDRRWNEPSDNWGGSRQSDRDFNWRDRNADDNQGQGDRRNEGRGGWGQSNGRDRFPRGGTRFDRDDGDGNKEEIYVRTFEVGRLIGSGGSKIKSLQTDSKCRIKISRDGSNGVNLVELIGSPEQIQAAKALVAENVDIVDRTGSNPDAQEEPEPEPTEVKRRAPIDWSKVYQSSQELAKSKFKDLPPIIKEFYEELDDIANLSREEVSLIRSENNNIIVETPKGDARGFPNPIRTFEDGFHNYPLILEQIYRQNFVKPSPIQCQAWPVLLQGKDMIGIAQTGTGKTLAFLLPALIHIDNQPIPRQERSGPSALILSPTRELAQQIEMEVNKINYKGIRSICVYGGGNRREQMAKVKKGVEIVVATPGRLNDFLMNGIIDVTNVTYLVMDEADRMLDLGFELEIKKVMMDIRPDRQTVMTSATWPDEVQHMADSYMTDPYKVYVGTLDLAAVHSVKQYVEICQDYEKKDMILDFIRQMEPQDKVIIFVGKKIIADDLSSDLAMSDIVCQCIHGDREQCDREAALSEFKSGYVRILVATDVASRGLDVPDITHVINYDFPRHIEEYVHRIGRTGRAGRSGVAITFVTRGDWKSAQQLIDIMAEADQDIPDDLVTMAERYSSFKQKRDQEGFAPGFRGGRGRGRGGRGRRRDDDEMFFM